MARRPMHLRWIYVKDHAPLFAALAALLIVTMIGVVFLVPDPARGLLLGILPTIFGLVVWAITNRSGYPDRTPETLAHERSGVEEETDDQGEVWDPFEGQRRPVPDVDHPPSVSGDPFDSAAPSQTRNQAENEPTAPGTATAAAATKARRTKPSPTVQNPTTTGAAKPTTTKQPKGASTRNPTPNAAATPQPGPEARKPAPPAARNPSTPGKPKPDKVSAGKSGRDRNPAPGSSQPATADAKDHQTRKVSEKRDQAATASAPSEPLKPPSKRAREAVASNRPVKEADPPAAQKNPAPSPDHGRLVSPAEAAKRDAAVRKRSNRKRGGNPDAAP